MKRIRAQIEIEASPAAVWAVLTDFSAYPVWNSFIRLAEGAAVIGSRLALRIETPVGFAMTIRPVVLRAKPERELRWLGHLGLPGLFDGEHSFVIEPLGPSCVRLVQTERFSGILVSLFVPLLKRRTLPGFERMNRDLKARVESMQ